MIAIFIDFVTFQALISGAIVERMTMKSWVIFIVVWATLVYDFLAHLMWSAWPEIIDSETEVKFGWLRGLGVEDFAGGTVVHISSGWSALVASTIVGKRRVWNDENRGAVTPHNLPILLLGACLIWFGW